MLGYKVGLVVCSDLSFYVFLIRGQDSGAYVSKS